MVVSSLFETVVFIGVSVFQLFYVQRWFEVRHKPMTTSWDLVCFSAFLASRSQAPVCVPLHRARTWVGEAGGNGRNSSRSSTVKGTSKVYVWRNLSFFV